MDADVKAKWLAALRSGDYKQARGYLRTEAGYCCFGVLCDIVDPEGWGQLEAPPDAPAEVHLGPDRYSHRGMIGLPDRGTINNTGLPKEAVQQLVGLNDSGETFGTIANVIERQW